MNYVFSAPICLLIAWAVARWAYRVSYEFEGKKVNALFVIGWGSILYLSLNCLFGALYFSSSSNDNKQGLWILLLCGIVGLIVCVVSAVKTHNDNSVFKIRFATVKVNGVPVSKEVLKALKYLKERNHTLGLSDETLAFADSLYDQYCQARAAKSSKMVEELLIALDDSRLLDCFKDYIRVMDEELENIKNSDTMNSKEQESAYYEIHYISKTTYNAVYFLKDNQTGVK